jgi:hypothetical protein
MRSRIELESKPINLDELTKELIKIDPDILISRSILSDKTEIVIDSKNTLTKEKQAAIEAAIADHNPEYSEEETIEAAEQAAFDARVAATLTRLGVVIPKR